MTTVNALPGPAPPSPDERPAIQAQELLQALRANQPVGDRFSRHIIEGAVDLNSIAYSHKLVIHDSAFRGRFDASEARFTRTVDLSGCTFEHGVTLEGTHVLGD